MALNSMRACESYPALLVKMVQALTSFCLVGEAARRLLLQEGALATVRQVAARHRSHVQLTRAAELFALKLGGTGLRRSADRAEVDLADYVEVFVSEDARNLLQAGGLFEVACGEERGRAVLRSSADWSTLLWQERGRTTGVKGQLPLRNLKDVRCAARTAGRAARSSRARRCAVQARAVHAVAAATARPLRRARGPAASVRALRCRRHGVGA